MGQDCPYYSISWWIKVVMRTDESLQGRPLRPGRQAQRGHEICGILKSIRRLFLNIIRGWGHGNQNQRQNILVSELDFVLLLCRLTRK